MQQRMTENQETYVAFIDLHLQKAFDKVWNSAIFLFVMEKRNQRKT